MAHAGVRDIEAGFTAEAGPRRESRLHQLLDLYDAQPGCDISPMPVYY